MFVSTYGHIRALLNKVGTIYQLCNTAVVMQVLSAFVQLYVFEGLCMSICMYDMYVCILGVGHLLGTDYAASHGIGQPRRKLNFS